MNLRVLFILPDLDTGGAQTMNLRLAQALSSKGWPVQLAVLFDRPGGLRREYKKEISIVLYDARSFLDKMMLFIRLMCLAKKFDAVVGGLEFAATNYGFIASRLAGRPFLSWTHIAFAPHQTTARTLDRTLSRLIYRFCHDVVFPSKGAKESLRKALGGQPRKSRWHVIENFIHLSATRPCSQIKSHDHIFASPVVVSIGRLVKQKGFDRLIRTHAALLRRGLKHHLLILGEGPLREKLEELVRSLQVSSTVFMPGHVPNPTPWLRRCQVFALSSRYEGFSLALLEALASGIPCVAMDCPSGPKEILEDGKFGILTPGDDEVAFQRGIERLFADPELYAHYARVGPERARDFTPEQIVPQWEALLMKIVGRRGR